MGLSFLLIGIGIGCFMYAFVNGRYNKKKWIAGKYIWAAGLLAIIIGVILLL